MNRTHDRPTSTALPLVCAVLIVAATGSATAADPGYVGGATCLECHQDHGARLARTVHGRLAAHQYAGEARECEACHGPGAEHVAAGDGSRIAALKGSDGDEASRACLACHRTGATWDWDLSAHSDADVSCTACHTIHGKDAQPALLTKSEPELCFTCHADQKARFHLPSHHPVQEGQMACSSCHDQHGASFASLRAGETARDLCLGCHAQYQGPFVFEHSPVQEDCAVCHDVHGTVANNLLRQNEPFLCLNCHQPHFHSGLMGAEGEFAPPATDGAGNSGPATDYPAYGDLSLVSHPDSWKMTMLTKCTQCHASVHGTDLPSQGISGQGRALNR